MPDTDNGQIPPDRVYIPNLRGGSEHDLRCGHGDRNQTTAKPQSFAALSCRGEQQQQQLELRLTAVEKRAKKNRPTYLDLICPTGVTGTARPLGVATVNTLSVTCFVDRENT